ncbi:MAG: D-alanine--D-alanine ligase family protein [Planctomycetota bacterium]|jgi:D-alanine-D-alanine ligase|nr:D-alanine--D-alanine ligase family protein [Planctomycetota bacterium]
MTSSQPLTNLCLLFGGTSEEHEISLRSARAVRAHLNPQRYVIHHIGITRDGHWLDEKNSRAMLDGNDFTDSKRGPYLPSDVDVVFPVLHGPGGEDGTVQGWLEMQKVPFVGSGCLGSAIAMDKSIAKHILRSANIPILPWLDVSKSEWQDDALEVASAIAAKFDYPLYVKPTQQGSSVGISRVEDKDDLSPAVTLAFEYSDFIMVEPAADGSEYEVAILDGKVPVVSLPGEIEVEGWYDYDNKYVNDNANIVVPATSISPRMADELRDMALKAFRALRLEGYARVDFLLNKKAGRVALNEVNTIPGFTDISMFPKLMESSGVEFEDLVDRMIEFTLPKKIASYKTPNRQTSETVA